MFKMIERWQRWSRPRPFLCYTLPLGLYMALLLVLSLASLSRLPRVHVEDADKIGHALAYLILGMLMLRWTGRHPGPPGTGRLAAVLAFLAASAWGLAIEGLQFLAPYRSADAIDAAANCFGALLGVMIWIGLSRAGSGRPSVPAYTAKPPSAPPRRLPPEGNRP